MPVCRGARGQLLNQAARPQYDSAAPLRCCLLHLRAERKKYLSALQGASELKCPPPKKKKTRCVAPTQAWFIAKTLLTGTHFYCMSENTLPQECRLIPETIYFYMWVVFRVKCSAIVLCHIFKLSGVF